MRPDVQRVRQYELMAIFAPDVPEEDLQGQVDRVSTIVTDAGGTVTLINRESPWGRRRLAYPIRHNGRDVRDGIYALYYFDLDAERVVDLERDLKLTDSVIRFMVTQQTAAPMAPPEPEPEAGEASEGAEPESAATADEGAAAASAEVATDAGEETAPEAEGAAPTSDESATDASAETATETQGDQTATETEAPAPAEPEESAGVSGDDDAGSEG